LEPIKCFIAIGDSCLLKERGCVFMGGIVINATQHVATAEQKAVGVWDLSDDIRKKVQRMITFDEIPSPKELEDAAQGVVDLLILAQGSIIPGQEVMIGGAPFFMASLENAIRRAGARPVYAFSKRESMDEPQKDGSIKKVTVFRHAGFVRV